MNPFRGTEESPHHISVGVILMNDKNKIACHYFADPKIRNYPKNFYTLLHETVEAGESLEKTVERGLKEEYSMIGIFGHYVGSIVSHFNIKDVSVEKTVLYFVCTLTCIENRDLSDPESASEIKWMDIDELIEVMKRQGEDDESKILEDVKKFYLS